MHFPDPDLSRPPALRNPDSHSRENESPYRDESPVNSPNRTAHARRYRFNPYASRLNWWAVLGSNQ